ncbi:PREDICTED: ubiquitin carboxyl-terminal hydrolase 1-like isoform X1 [Branchiostoma belcheri]|nr:PREDICTED: ubiquitin carboxyl-terminal hydrolase 1-like isoform X1 [Branchiostoma belcheri]
MVEEHRVCTTSGQQDMDAPPRKRSKLSLSSRRRDDSSSVGVTSTRGPTAVYPLFEVKGTDSSSVAEKPENSHVESDSPSVVLDVPTAPSKCDVRTVMSTYRYGEFVPFVGLFNLHNTCYMNSVLQILIHTPQFALRLAHLQGDLRDIYVDARARFDKALKRKFSESEFSLLNELCRLFRKVGTLKLDYILAPEARTERLAIEPVRTLDAIKEAHGQFAGSLQHDAQEFLRCVLSSLQDANASILQYQAGRREEIRRQREKLDIILAAKQSKREATMIKYVPDARPEKCHAQNGVQKNQPSNGVAVQGSAAVEQMKQTMYGCHAQNGVQESRPSNGVAVQGSPAVEKPPKLKKKRLGVGHARNQIKITRFASPSDTVTAPRASVNGHSGHADDTAPRANDRVSRVPVNGHNGHTDDDPGMVAKLTNGTGDMEAQVDGTLAQQVSTVKLDEKTAECAEEKMETEPSVNGTNGHVRDGPENPSPTEDSPESLQLAEEDFKMLQADMLTNIVEDLFEGSLEYETSCLQCEMKSHRREKFMDLSLPVKMNREPDDLQQATGDVSPEKEADDKADVVSLSWSLETFMAAEKLDRENKYKCEYCGSQSEAERKVFFAKLPRILTIHLKRFEYNLTGSAMSKIHSPILTPSHLKLNRFCTEACTNKLYKYEIYGIILHEGSALDSGHYVAYVKAPIDYPFIRECCLKDESSSSPPGSPTAEETDTTGTEDVKVVDLETSNGQPEREQQLATAFAEYDHSLHWIKFNDSTVTVLTEEEVAEVFLPEKTNTLSPYLLFYRRTDIAYTEAPCKPEKKTCEPEKSVAEQQGNTKTEATDSPEKEEEKEEDISR